jgi:hypothetical protein
LTLRCLDGDELLVRDASPAQVGELASGAGIALHELVEESPTLEKVFLELTAGGRSVIAQLRSELRKMRTTRTNLGLLTGLVALVLLAVIGGAFGASPTCRSRRTSVSSSATGRSVPRSPP